MLFQLLTGSGDLKTKLIFVALYLIAIIVSLSFHEWAHAHAAHSMGDDTAMNLGRMTLNPMAHIDPSGFLMLLLLGFGWAKPVPVNPRNYRNYRWGEFRVSFAGIFTNLIIALISAFLYVGFSVYEIRTGSEMPELLYTFLYIVGILNCSLAIFNFIPVYPLDGAHIFDLVFGKLVGSRVLLWMHRNGRFILYGIFILNFVFARLGFSPLGTAVNWLYLKFISLFTALANLIP
ncbi:MAG: site-2 protease family protein [Clostridia bacterium]|nr:site-2 protease family protein [Clostridia bacterium]